MRQLLACASFDRNVRVYDASSCKQMLICGHVNRTACSCWGLSDGKFAFDKECPVMGSGLGIDDEFATHSTLVSSVAFGRNGALASGSFDNTIKVWDSVTGEEKFLLGGDWTEGHHTGAVSSVAWGTDERLASASWDKTVKVWDASDRNALNGRMTSPQDSVNALAAMVHHCGRESFLEQIDERHSGILLGSYSLDVFFRKRCWGLSEGDRRRLNAEALFSHLAGPGAMELPIGVLQQALENADRTAISFTPSRARLQSTARGHLDAVSMPQ